MNNRGKFFFLVLVAALFQTVVLNVSAQWRIATPRDTVVVPANRADWIDSKMALTAGVEVHMTVHGTYKQLAGNPAQFDGGYCTYYPGWNIINPLRVTSNGYVNNNTTYQYGLKYQTIQGLGNEYYFVPSEQNYQPSHIYTQRVPYSSSPLSFKINSHNSNYSQAQGILTVRLARWTAGIAVKNYSGINTDVDFGSVMIGTSKTVLDSIASYGIDPLSVDSVYITGTDAAAFSFTSQRPGKFQLQTEQTNSFDITFTPNKRGDVNAQLVIVCRNADLLSQETRINLRGKGAEPTLAVKDRRIDFGKTRIGYPKFGYTYYYNGGNADLIINSTVYTDNIVYSRASPAMLPFPTGPGSTGGITTKFDPMQTVQYSSYLYIIGNNNLRDTVILTGEGARPIPELSEDTLFYGSVYSGDRVERKVLLTNKGNWPVSVTDVNLYGPLRVAYGYVDSKTFVVEPDSSKELVVYFKPGTTMEQPIFVDFVLTYDDNTRDTVRLRGTELTPKIVLDPLVYNFGKIKVGGQRTDVATRIRNIKNINIPFTTYETRPSRPFDTVGSLRSIAANSTDSIRIKFSPVTAGPAQGWFHIVAHGKKDSVLLLGEGVIAKGIFTPVPLSFGIMPSDVADTLTTTLADSGTLPLNVIRYEISGPDEDEFSVIEILRNGVPVTVPFTIAEGAAVDFRVRFMTSDRVGGTHHATLCVFYDDSTSDCLPLEAVEETQYAQFTRPSIDFGKVRLRTRDTLPASFRNASNIPLTVGSVSLNTVTDAFTIIDTLKPILSNSSINIGIEFHPKARGPYSGYFVASGGDFRTDSMALRGIGAAPVVVFSDDVINFGTVALNASEPRDLFVYDTGNWDMNVLKVFIRGDNDNEFAFSHVNGGNTSDPSYEIIIPEQSSAQYQVVFTPSVTSAYHSAELVFLLDDSTEEVVQLVGLDESPNLVLGEDTLNFKKVRLGQPGIMMRAHLINTSQNNLVVTNLHLDPASSDFTALPIGNVPVAADLPGRQLDVNVTFTPTAYGQIEALLISEGGDAITDTTVLIGIGAEPRAKFTPDAELDFGDVLYGSVVTRTFILQNVGNWIFQTSNVQIAGMNSIDFTAPTIFQQFSVDEDSTVILSVTFTARTPLQLMQDRTAEIVFTLDDNTEVRYALRARDREPFKTDVRFDNAAARLSDVIYPNLRLVTAIPDSLRIDSMRGTVIYDPKVIEVIEIGLAQGLIDAGGWTLIKNSVASGSFSYEIVSPINHLTNPVSLMRLTIRPAKDVSAGAQTLLEHTMFEFTGRRDVEAQLTHGVIVIDSNCGNTHIIAGNPTANMIDQIHPNPVSSQATIPFDIGSEGAAVTVRILDMSGREVLRPLQGEMFKQGRYGLNVDVSQLQSGSYIYEFRAGADKPILKKMMVQK